MRIPRSEFWRRFFATDAENFSHGPFYDIPLWRDRARGIIHEAKTPILEVGCGDGNFLRLCSDMGKPATGIDASSERVGKCLDQGLDVSVDDITHTVAIDNEMAAYNSVVFMDSLEHIPDCFAALVSAYNLLKPDGILFVSFLSFKDIGITLPPSVLHAFSPLSLLMVLNQVGFIGGQVLLKRPPYVTIKAVRGHRDFDMNRMLVGNGPYGISSTGEK